MSQPAPVESTRGTGDRRLRRMFSVFRRSRTATAGAVIVLIVVLVAIFAPVLAPHDPNLVDLTVRRLPPGSGSYILGTDHMGRDLLSRIIWGARISLQVGIIAVGLGWISGTILGLMAGYFRGPIEVIILRIIDIMICFPTLLLALAIVAILGPAMTNVMFAVGLTMMPQFARIVRASVLSIREMEYVEAARGTGAGTLRIILRHILPNASSSMIVFATLGVGAAILTEASLSFLGLGVPPPTPTWGGIVAEGRRFLLPSPWISILPGLVIMVTVLGLNFFGDGVRDALDPRLRGERELQ